MQPDKERANFCDWFSLNDKNRPGDGQYKEREKAESARAAFDNLFGKEENLPAPD
jgi:hypothetical protein